MAKPRRDNRRDHGTDTKLKPVRDEHDLLQLDYFTRKHPRPVPPTGIFDEDLYCLKFNELWIPHITGALHILLEKDSWSGGDAEIFRAQQSILLMLENLTAPCDSGELNMRTPEFRSIVVDELCDQTQWKYVDEPDTEWRNLGTPTCDGEDGEDGEQGLPGEDGEDGAPGEPGAPGECPDCEEPIPPNPTEPEDEDGLYCSIAINMASNLHSLHDAMYENNDDWFALIFGGGGVITAIAAILFPAIAVGAAILTALGGLVTFLNGLIGLGEINAFDSAAEEQFRCDIYCILKAHETTEITAGILDEWADKIEEYTIMGEQRFAIAKLVREASPVDFWQWIAYASSEVDPAACDCECVECSETMIHNFVYDPEEGIEENYGWEPIEGEAPSDFNCGAVDHQGAVFNTVRGPFGWRVTETAGGSGFDDAVGIVRTFSPHYQLCKADVTIGNSNGSSNTRQTTLWVQLVDGTWEALECRRLNIFNSSSPSLHWEGDAKEIQTMKIVGTVGGGTMTISEVKLNDGV